MCGTSSPNNFLRWWWQQRKSLVQQRWKLLTAEKQALPFNHIFVFDLLAAWREKETNQIRNNVGYLVKEQFYVQESEFIMVWINSEYSVCVFAEQRRTSIRRPMKVRRKSSFRLSHLSQRIACRQLCCLEPLQIDFLLFVVEVWKEEIREAARRVIA